MSEQPDLHQQITGAEYAATSATGDANIQIYNYYYREQVSTESSESDDVGDENLPCPYRGLFHFGPDNAEYFFGRELFVEELFVATQSRNFIPVLGASGSGKSSVVLAGLLPKLQQSGHWLFTHFRPRSNPFHSLALALVRLYTENLDATDRIIQARKLAKSLHEGDLPLADVFAQINQNYPTHRILLIADQFEELYTLCSNREIRHSFLDTLLTCFQSSESQSQFNNVLVTTMRVDFLGNALSYRPFADLLQNADIKLGPMNHDELSQVIVKPAERLGVTFETGLVERILDDLEDEPGNLPLLQFALTQLWKQRIGKRLTHAAYEKIGEVQGALARHADRNYQKLSATEQEQVRRIFIQLVRPGEGTEDTRRLATKAELDESSWGLVKKLADARLVVTSRNSADRETVEVVHEALIHHWGELRKWMHTDRNFRAWQERLRNSLYQWQQLQQDEGALLRGVALADAEEKLKQRPEDLGEDEENFIEASVVLRDREKKQRLFERRLAFSMLAGGLMLTLGLFSFAWFEWQQSEKTLVKQSDALANYSLELFHQGKHLDALIEALRAGISLRNRKSNIAKQIAALQVVYEIEERNRLEINGAQMESAAFSPDGNTIVTIADRSFKFWSLQGQLIKTFEGHNAAIESVTFSPDGKTIASASKDKTIKLWSLQGQVIKTFNGHSAAIESVVFSPDGKTIASASKDKTIKLWNLQGQVIKTFKGHNAAVESIAFSPDGRNIASASEDKTVRIWDFQGKEIKILKGHSATVESVVFSPDGKTIASASEDKTVKLWNLQGQVIKVLKLDDDRVGNVAFSPNGKTIVSNSNRSVKLWNLQGQEIKTIRGHGAPITNVVFSPAIAKSPTGFSYTIASVGGNKVKLWNLKAQQIENIPSKNYANRGHSSRIKKVVFSPNGNMIASGSEDKNIKLWNLQGQIIKTLKGHQATVEGVTFSPDGNTLASASADKTLKLWNLQGQLIRTFEGHKAPVKSVVFSPDGNSIASASVDKTVKLWNLQGEIIKTFKGHRAPVESVAFSADGSTIISGSEDKTVKLWDIQSQKIKASLEHGYRVKSVALNHNDLNSSNIVSPGTIASAGGDEVKLWNLQGQEVLNFRNHGAPVESVIFHPDGNTIAFAGGNKVELWNSLGEQIISFRKHKSPIQSIAFSPNGKTIVSASADGTIKLWSFNFVLDDLLVKGCSWVRDYLKYNASLSEEDRRLCDRIDGGK